MTHVRVTDLTKDFSVGSGLRRRAFRAVDSVSFDLAPGRTVALVGESGSGKSTIARMLARLEKPSSSSIDVTLDDGTPVQGSLYRRHVQMVFQDPFASLNPFHSIEHHLARQLRLHGRTRGAEATHERDRATGQQVERHRVDGAERLAADALADAEVLGQVGDVDAGHRGSSRSSGSGSTMVRVSCSRGDPSSTPVRMKAPREPLRLGNELSRRRV